MTSFGKDLAIAIVMLVFLLPQVALADRAKARALTAEGQNQQELGYHAEALDLYENAIGSDPDYHASYELAIPLWMRFGKLAKAQASLEALTLRCKHCSFAWYALGALYRKAGRFDLAVLAYEAYLAKRPKDPDAYFGLAMALGAQADPKASAVLRRYLVLEDRQDRSAFRLQAERLLRRLASTSPIAAEKPVVATQRSERASLRPVAELVASGQLVSAESLLSERYGASPATLALRAKIAKARGDWFQQGWFTALGWFWP